MRRSAPPSSRCVANAWRRRCGCGTSRRSVEVSRRRPRAERKSAFSAPRASCGPRLAQVARDEVARPPRRAARRGPSRPCPRGRARAPARSRRRRGRARPPRRCAARPSRRARRARGCGARSGPSPSKCVDDLLDLGELRRVGQPPRPLRRERRVGHALRAERCSAAASARPTSLRAIVAGASLPCSARARPSSATQSASTRTSTSSSGLSGPNQLGELAQVGRVGATGRVGDARRREEPLGCRFEGHTGRVRRRGIGSPADGLTAGRASPSSAVHGANVQPGQIVAVSAELGQEELARAVAAAAYERGAKFVDVVYFDPHLKRARIQNADPGHARLRPAVVRRALLAHAELRRARASRSPASTEPNAARRPRHVARRQGPAAVAEGDGQDRRRAVDQLVRSSRARTRPGPRSSIPICPADEAYERLWRELEHVLRLDEPDPVAAWDERMAVLNDSARARSPSGASTRSSCAARAPS